MKYTLSIEGEGNISEILHALEMIRDHIKTEIPEHIDGGEYLDCTFGLSIKPI